MPRISVPVVNETGIRSNNLKRPNYHAVTKKASSNGILVSRLADEVLLEIFLLLYSLWSDTSGGHPKRSELAVCKKWRHLILSTPILWSKVSYPSAKPGYEKLNILSFQRSKTAFLGLTINASPNRLVKETVSFELVAQHASRVRSMHVIARDIDDLNDTFRHWGRLNTPNLRAVRITGEKLYENWPVAIPTDANNRCLGVDAWPTISSLQDLTLIGFSPFQFPSALNLRTLYISSIKLTTKGLLDITQQFPALESLAIDRVCPWYNRMGEDGYEREAIYIPSLRKLALGSGRKHDENCICAMGCIAAPNLELLELRCTSSVLNDDHLGTMMLPKNTRHLQRIRLAAAEITLEDMPYLASLSPMTDLELPQLERCTNHAAHILTALLELTNFNSITIYIQPRCAPDGMIWASNRVFADNRFVCDMIIIDQPEIGSPLRLRGLDVDVNQLPPEVEEVLGGEVRTMGLNEGEPWIISAWDSLQTYEFSDFEDDLESGEEDDFDYGCDSLSE